MANIELKEDELKQLLAQQQQLIDQNNALAKRIVDLESGTQGPRVVRREAKEHKVKLRRVDGKYVIGFKNRGEGAKQAWVYPKPNPDNPKEELLYIDLILDGAKEPVSVKYNEFLREAEEVWCTVVEKKVEEREIEQGMVPRREVEDYRMIDTGTMVPVVVTWRETVYVVKTDDDRTLEVHEQFINI